MAQTPRSVVYMDPHLKDIYSVCAIYSETTVCRFSRQTKSLGFGPLETLHQPVRTHRPLALRGGVTDRERFRGGTRS